MNHQPFEEWCFKRSTHQEQELHCTHICKTALPAPTLPQLASGGTRNQAGCTGCTGNWFQPTLEARLAGKRAQKQRRLAWWVIGINLSAALGIFLH